MSHILFLSQILPYPPNAGPRVKTWQVLRYLASRGHQITLVSYIRPEEEPFVPIVQELVHAVQLVPLRRTIWRELSAFFRSLLSGRPYLIERDDDPRMRTKIADLLRENPIDVIHADQVSMTQFVLSEDQKPRIFDAHNATWAILEGSKIRQPAWKRPVISREARSMKKYEGEVVSDFDVVLAVTEKDKIDLLAAAQSWQPASTKPIARIEVVPITVDTQEFVPAQTTAKGLEILSVGSLHYAPNADGVRWFLNEVFPGIAQDIEGASVNVVGKKPPSDFWKIAAKSGGRIRIKGYVPDLDPLFESAAVMVVPVLSGSGMRVRILEGLARGMPMVTTTLGAQGIEVSNTEHILIADSPAEFERAVCKLLTDESQRRKLSRSGRTLAVERYDWRQALNQMDWIYKQAGNS